MNKPINILIKKIAGKNLKPDVNLERPLYIQPEDSIKYRSSRIIIICGMLNTKNGLSKEIIACVDFLLRNTNYQKKFIIEYFREQKNLLKKLNSYSTYDNIETDLNLVQYRSVPWDLRFNDMLLFLYVRKLIKFKGNNASNVRIILTEKGKIYYTKIEEVFVDEVNFLELFGRRLDEKKTKKIITEVIPNSYWRENEKLNY